MQLLQRIVQPPHYSDEYQNAHAKFLHIALWITFVMALYFANINEAATRVVFAVLAASSLLGLLLNYLHYYFLSASIPVVIGTLALFFNFYDGISLFDPGIVALPLLVILASFLFGSQMIYRVAFVNILGVLLLAWFERTGVIAPPRLASNERVIIITILIAFAAILQKNILLSWERAVASAQRSEQRVRDAYMLTLEGWAKTLEFHDRETLGHSQRVTALCIHLAHAMGIHDPQELEYIRWGALMHDIGKLAIPFGVLHKVGDLSSEEWAIIRKHPLVAEELLGNIDFLQPALSIPRAHHENWDGSGYPRRLAGEEIPLHARLFAVVDNWDALTSDRPYRKAWSREQTIAYLQEERGRKFDPQIVDVFIANVAAGTDVPPAR
jgi:putative nucleotidyltransferase with HDIG domain